MTGTRENSRGLSWLAERWSTAVAAALQELGAGVSAHEWRPVADAAAMDAARPGALWWKERAGEASAESVSIGVGPMLQTVLSELTGAAGTCRVSLPDLMDRAAQIVKGVAGRGLLELAPSGLDGQMYSIRVRLGSGQDVEFALACRPGTGLSEPAAVRDRMGMLLKVEVPLTISLGDAEMPLREALKLARGSVVELDRTFDDPVEVIVNGRVVARGDIVVVEEKYAVRIREVYREESSQIWPGMGIRPVA